jgi:tetratricopeptide (TPR) repeat protein
VAALAARYRKLSQVYDTLAEWESAEEAHRTGLGFAESLVDRAAASADHRLELALHWLRGGELAIRSGHFEEAQSLARRATEELTSKRRDQDPPRLDSLVAEMKGRLMLADVLRRQGRFAEAQEQATRHLVNIQQAQRTTFHDSRELVQLEAEANELLASIAVDLGQPETAAEHLRTSLDLKQQNLRAKLRPIVFDMQSFFDQKHNFDENFEVVPFCTYSETQLKLADVLRSLDRPYEAERLLGEAMLMGHLYCGGEDGHHLRYMLLYATVWNAAAELVAGTRPEEAENLRKACNSVCQSIAACFPQAIGQADLPPSLRVRIMQYAGKRAPQPPAAQLALYKNMPSTPVWETPFVHHALALSWSHVDLDAAIDSFEDSAKVRTSGHVYDWLQIAIGHAHLGNAEEARDWLDKSIAAMGENPHIELNELRAEAEVLLGDALSNNIANQP